MFRRVGDHGPPGVDGYVVGEFPSVWGVATMPAAYVAGKRWSYAPAIKSFIWQPTPPGSTYAYRPFGI